MVAARVHASSDSSMSGSLVQCHRPGQIMIKEKGQSDVMLSLQFQVVAGPWQATTSLKIRGLGHLSSSSRRFGAGSKTHRRECSATCHQGRKVSACSALGAPCKEAVKVILDFGVSIFTVNFVSGQAP